MKTFMQWLSESLMMPVYHGGSWDGITPIKVQGRGSLGSGAYFSPYREIAARYAKESGQNYITEANLNLIKPLVINTSLYQHPCVEALIQLSMPPDRASSLVEKVEGEKGYMGKEISSRAMKQGYDSLMQYRDGQLMEIVIWDQSRVLSGRKIPLSEVRQTGPT